MAASRKYKLEDEILGDSGDSGKEEDTTDGTPVGRRKILRTHYFRKDFENFSNTVREVRKPYLAMLQIWESIGQGKGRAPSAFTEPPDVEAIEMLFN